MIRLRILTGKNSPKLNYLLCHGNLKYFEGEHNDLSKRYLVLRTCDEKLLGKDDIPLIYAFESSPYPGNPSRDSNGSLAADSVSSSRLSILEEETVAWKEGRCVKHTFRVERFARPFRIRTSRQGHPTHHLECYSYKPMGGDESRGKRREDRSKKIVRSAIAFQRPWRDSSRKRGDRLLGRSRSAARVAPPPRYKNIRLELCNRDAARLKCERGGLGWRSNKQRRSGENGNKSALRDR